MKIVVCLKQVPSDDSIMKIAANGRWIDEDNVGFEMNESDTHVLEEALQLKEKHGGEVVAVSAGPVRVELVIKEALAKGADRGILIEDDRFVGADSFTVAKALSAAILRERPYDLILTGLQSNDTGFGQTGLNVAELLDLPSVSIVVETQVKENNRMRVKQELEAGYSRYVTVSLPALLTIQSGINKVRYANLAGIKKSKNKPIARLCIEELGVVFPSSPSFENLHMPPKSNQIQILEGSLENIANQLVEKLKTEKGVI